MMVKADNPSYGETGKYTGFKNRTALPGLVYLPVPRMEPLGFPAYLPPHTCSDPFPYIKPALQVGPPPSRQMLPLSSGNSIYSEL